MGRHTNFDQEKADKIVEAIKSGEQPTKIYKKFGVSPFTAREWRAKNEDFSKAYNEAMEIYWLGQFDKMTDEATDRSRDTNIMHIRRSELIINTLRIRAQMMHPDKYSDKYKSWIRDCPEFGDKMPVNQRLELIYKLLADKKLSIEDTEKLVKLIDIQFRVDDLQKLSDEIKELKQIVEKSISFK